jgi:uncharacterized protein YhhL (DUF1145 family)
MIQHRLVQLAKRLRSQILALLLIAFWSVLLIGIITAFRQGLGIPYRLLTGLILVGAGLLLLWSRFGYRDLRALAERIERQFPELDEKLLTAIEPANPNASEFLRRKLIEETLSHAKKTEWNQIVPRGRLSFLWCIQWILLLTTVSLPWMMPGKFKSDGPSSGGKRELLVDWQVEPGDAQIEKGADLLVTVRFPDEFAEDVRLVVEEAGEATQNISLQRSLKDPIASGMLRKVNESFRYRVESDTKQSESFSIEIFEHPSVVQSDALIQSPSYAQQEDKRVINTRRVSVVDGAQVVWDLKLNKEVASAQWIDENGKTTQLAPLSEDPTNYRIEETPTGSTRYRLELVDQQGRTEKMSEEFIVKVIPNREPELKLTSASDQRVSPIQEMMVGAKVQDDFGIQRAGISISIGDKEPNEIELPATGESDIAKKKRDLMHLIDLEAMQAKADQLVTYHFWTEDLDRNGQPRRVDSEMFFAEIRPFEELFREGDASATQQRQQQQQQQGGSPGAQQAEELAELQKKIITATWNLLRGTGNSKEPQSQEFLEKVQVVEDSQQQAIEQSEKLKEDLQSPESLQDLLQLQANMGEALRELQSIEADSESIGLRDAIKSMRAAYEGLLRLRAREHEVTQNQQQQSQNQRSQSSSQRNRQQQIEQLQLEQDPSRYEEESQPMSEESPAEREMRQVMNRLDELARRQQDLNEQVRELDLALQAAKDQEAKKELQERLDRLREEQQELVQDADELIERMNESETRNALEESRQAIESARQQMQESQQQLRDSAPSAALNSGTRAQQNVEETREKLREQSSEALQRDVESLVKQAEKLAQKQSQLERKLAEQSGIPAEGSSEKEQSQNTNIEPRESLLRSDSELNQEPSTQQQTLEAWKDQKQDYVDLLEQIKETVQRAEGSEALLAEQLYETYREANQQPTQQRLERIPMMIERGMDQPAVEESKEVSKDLQGLKDKIQRSSQSVLGSEEESLKRALQELEQANRAIEQEFTQRTPNKESQPESPQRERSRAGQPQEGQPQEGQPREGQAQEGVSPGDPTGDSEAKNAQRQSEQGQNTEGQNTGGQSVLEQLRQRISGAQGSGRTELSAPLMGEDYARWTDQLRDIEELVRDTELKAQATRVREAAREFRMEYKRHSKEPQWDLVKKMVSNPLKELQRKVQEELVRKTAKQNELIPLDRDPVPEKFRSELDRYFERLGGEQSK